MEKAGTALWLGRLQGPRHGVGTGLRGRTRGSEVLCGTEEWVPNPEVSCVGPVGEAFSQNALCHMGSGPPPGVGTAVVTNGADVCIAVRGCISHWKHKSRNKPGTCTMLEPLVESARAEPVWAGVDSLGAVASAAAGEASSPGSEREVPAV